MPLKVIPFAQYLTVRVDNMRDLDFAATLAVKAVKGEIVRGRQQRIKLGNRTFVYGPGQPQGGVDLWLTWAAPRVEEAVPHGPIVLVPVPNSGAVVGGAANFRTAVLARQLAAAIGPRVSVATELWWSEPMTPAHEGGPRFAHQLYPFLVAQPDQQPGTRVLVDDVMTSGGHFQACAAKLREIGHEPGVAICCGRTKHEQLEHPFVVPVEELPDFDPANPFGFDIVVEE